MRSPSSTRPLRPTSVAALVCCVLSTSTAWGAPSLVMHPEGTGVIALDEAGNELFQIPHHTLAKNKHGGPSLTKIVAPVKTAKGYLYSVASTLFFVDFEQQAIVERTFFGANILDLRVVEGGGLDVKLELNIVSNGVEGHPQREEWFPAFRTKEDAVFVPGNGLWSRTSSFSDLPKQADKFLEKGPPKTQAGRKALDEELEKVELRDRTNVLAPAYRALIAQADGRSDDADKHLQRALITPSRTGMDEFRTCGVALALGKIQLATTLCGLGKDKLLELGVREEALTSILFPAFALGNVRVQIDKAIEEQDAKKAHVGMELMYASFPRSENGVTAWALLSDWLQSKGEVELAAIWSQRVKEAMAVPANASRIELPRRLDHWILFWSCFFLAQIAAAFIVGMRSGRRYDADDDGSDVANTRAYYTRWLPRPSATELGIWAILTAGVFIGTFSVGHEFALQTEQGSVPIAATQDVMGAPSVLEWAYNDSHSKAERDLVAFGVHVFQRAKVGKAPAQPKPALSIVDDVVRAKVEHFGTRSILETSLGLATDRSAIFFLVAIFALFIGHALGRASPKLTRIVSYFIVGSTPSALAILSITILLAAVLRQATMLGTFFRSLMGDGPSALYGLGDVSLPYSPLSQMSQLGFTPLDTTPMWTSIALAFVLLFHFAFVGVDIMRWRSE